LNYRGRHFCPGGTALPIERIQQARNHFNESIHVLASRHGDRQGLYTAFPQRGFQRRQVAAGFGEIDLVQHHDLRPSRQVGIEQLQLAVDHVHLVHGVGVRSIQHVNEHARALYVP